MRYKVFLESVCGTSNEVRMFEDDCPNPTFERFIGRLKTAFGLQVDYTKHLTVYHLDDEGDRITISSDEELRLVIDPKVQGKSFEIHVNKLIGLR